MKKDRESNLHRHPCFFGFVDDILKDCCGQCPAPTTDEEKELAAKERKTYVYGDLQFTKDDPGRQAIGSFNPLTDDDWTEMAYIGNTARLCQAIVDGDLEHVQDWCEQGGADSIDRRDHTGRTPLHLAAMVSTPEVVQCLIDHGARIVARLVDGFTALHIAARRGNTKIVNALLKRSEANEEEEEARRAKAKKTTLKAITRGEVEYEGEISQMEGISDSGDEDGLKDDDESEGSFVKVKRETLNHGETLPDDEWKNEPDIYDVNVLAWDSPVSPLHLAVLGGHVDVIETLCSMYGADVLLPVKLLDKSSRSPRAAILTLILAQLPPNERAEAVTKTLLSLGASSAQADMDEASALHYTVYQENVNILDILFDYDRPAATSALNHLRVEGSGWHHAVSSPLITAMKAKNLVAVGKLLSFGAKPTVEYEDYLSTLYRPRAQRGVGPPPSNREDNQRGYNERVQQPIVLAAEHNLPTVIQELLRKGVNPNTLEMSSYAVLLNPKSWMSVGSGTLLDVVRRKLKELREYDMMPNAEKPPPTLSQEDDYLSDIVKGTYQYWSAEKDLQLARKIVCEMQVDYEQKIQDQRKKSGYEETMEARRSLLRDLEVAENMILRKRRQIFLGATS